MKKVMVFMVAFMLLGSIGAFAAKTLNSPKQKKAISELKPSNSTPIKMSPWTVSGEYTSDCGTTWSYTISCYGNCGPFAFTSAYVQFLYQAEAACDTDNDYIEFVM